MVVAPASTATVIIWRRKAGIGAGAVFGRELDVVDEGAGEADGGGCLIERLFAGDLELGREVEIGGGEKDVDAGFCAGSIGVGGGFDVLALAAGERGDAGAFDLAGDFADRFRVPVEAMAKPASRMSTPRSAS